MKKILFAISFILLSLNAYGAGSSSSDSSTTVKKTDYEKAVSYIDKAKKFEEDGKQKKAEKQYEKRAIRFFADSGVIEILFSRIISSLIEATITD